MSSSANRLISAFLSTSLWMVPVHFALAWALASRTHHPLLLALPDALVPYRLLLVFCAFEVLPRTFALLTCAEWGIVGGGRTGTLPPYGVWMYVGNPLPEVAVRIVEPASGRGVTSACYFLQSPTLGGMLMSALHAVSQRHWPVAVVADPAHAFVKIHKPARGWQQDVLLKASNDPRVRWRSFYSAPTRHTYVWVHESHPCAPVEDYVFLSHDTLLRPTIACAVVLALVVWSWGVVLLVVGLEMLVKSAQYRAFVRCVAPLGVEAHTE